MIRIDGFLLDCATSETPVFAADVTSHPVEKGSDVTDNARVKPVQFTIEGIVSDTPMGVVKLEADRQGSATPSVTGYHRLLQIQSTKKLVTIVSDKYGTFLNMFLVTLSAPFTKDTGKSLMFTANFQQFVIIENNRTAVRTAVGNQGPRDPLGAAQASQVFPGRIYVTKGTVGLRVQFTKLNGMSPFWTDTTSGTDYYRVNYAGGAHADGFLTKSGTASSPGAAVLSAARGAAPSGSVQYTFFPIDGNYSSSANTWKKSDGSTITQSPGALGGSDPLSDPNTNWNAITKALGT